MGYEVKGAKYHKGGDGLGVNCNIYRDGKRVASYRDDGNGGMPIMDFASADERVAFEAYVAMWPNFEIIKGRMYSPSYDLVVGELLEWKDIAAEAKKETLFRIAGQAYKRGEWSIVDKPYSQSVREMAVNRYKAVVFRVDQVGQMVPITG